MKKTALVSLFLILLGLPLMGAKYDYTVDLTNFLQGKATVQVQFSSQQPQVKMNIDTYGVIRNFFQKIKDLKATDPQGNPINIINMGTYFVIQGQEGKLSYTVDLNYAPLNYGNYYDLPLLREKASMLGGYVLFAVPDEKAELTVKFQLPEGAKVITAWKEENGVFKVADTQSLREDVILIGGYKIHEAKAGDLNLRIAIHPDVSQASLQNLNNFYKLAGECIKYYSDTFGLSFSDRIPTFLLVINPVTASGKPASYFTGGIHHASAVFQLGAGRKILDIRFLALFSKIMGQLWTRVVLQGDVKKWLGFAPEVLWFQEGVENAFRILALRRAKAITDELLVKNFQTIYTYYRRNPNRTMQSLQDAAMAYFDDKNARRLLRDKSPLVILLMEEKIRKSTADKKGVADLMKLLTGKFSYLKQKVTLTNQVILQALQELTGKDFTPFFDKYVKGTEEIKLGPISGYSLLSKNK